MVHFPAPRSVDLQDERAFLDLAQGRLNSGKRFWALSLIPANAVTAAGIEIMSSTSDSDVAHAFEILTIHCPFVFTVLVDHASYWRSDRFLSAATNRRICLTYIPSYLDRHNGKAERFMRAYQTEVLEGPPLATINVARQTSAAWLGQRR